MQRNAYRGTIPRAWLAAGLSDLGRQVTNLAWLADTGSPMDLSLPSGLFDRYVLWKTQPRKTNYGLLDTGWFHLVLPPFTQPISVQGFRADNMAAIASQSDPALVGVIGLPILRRGRFGGDANEFWFDQP